MVEPVVAADGQSYERTAIERWLATKSTSPLTGGELERSILIPNHNLRRTIREWQEARAPFSFCALGSLCACLERVCVKNLGHFTNSLATAKQCASPPEL
ncbi:hypothetical protein EMIHUDRAFT_229287 [Emiliania huxleyi CCMP1516]|uniref:U-box domain-containing protein n=2 Tax=Emiliania huxleyi TaxID=2903 RepID=A0A0D3KDE5_EMIH1|nr:hypothetical protein EMIHUDRAFT_229287 [Emiliania huxleyi CCMP1516]EOD33780.1 hypothetical protein EMIHUDRAFT_229287 [Emiliania huxleyi CCMP1516]|eukprot:XP_005786209.1 hypothetical protein EMIHUDRAFT_229287 [Emiliania huxleyi CCMP1516]